MPYADDPTVAVFMKAALADLDGEERYPDRAVFVPAGIGDEELAGVLRGREGSTPVVFVRPDGSQLILDLEVVYELAEDGSVSARMEGLPVYSVGEDRADAERGVFEALWLYRHEQGSAD